MGAWGIGVFENDDAMDFIGDLDEDPKWSRVEVALKAVAGRRDYVEAWEASIAFAAAAIVSKALPDDYQQIGFALRDPPDAYVQLALQVLDRITGAESELLELWEEAGDTAEFLAEVHTVRQHLRPLT